jgi:hypothetical protein
MGPKGMGFPADGVENHGWKLYITSMVMIIVAGLVVFVRCASRIYLYNFGSDDIVIIVSLVSSFPILLASNLNGDRPFLILQWLSCFPSAVLDCSLH